MPKPGDLIFPNTIGGVEGHFLRKLQTIAERAGVAEPELHRFRKSYADTLADEGLPVPTILNRLGHCSLDVTLAYLRGREAEDERSKTLLTSQRWRFMHECRFAPCNGPGCLSTLQECVQSFSTGYQPRLTIFPQLYDE